ncbi:hypothetical protein [Pantoea ananatis]|uniref:hypothetical protein n=1 Tax=Pantoea ananas TaxID=553 RepID=UPI000CF3E885|nr:hypothetical protein [Pantoea ananatis]MDN4128402.1 hypothetical protein [Pantoea ananatis]MDN4152414.1 hypothetical protein [Pantoea ananatis]PQK83448.1 hypothetical protein CG431_17795 [Pantoea ananatis]RQN01469.1 hypothetical protein EHQ51_23585 [Pantoea ananatis]RQN01845.1 hypothetical protein EHQ51_22235 [Pantoea ananatis]
MSDENQPTYEERLIKAVRLMKADVDAIYTQLRDGTYADPDTFINNWTHLMDRVKNMKPVLSKPGVMETLMRMDVQLTAELLAITYSVQIIENFIRCMEHQARENGSKPR